MRATLSFLTSRLPGRRLELLVCLAASLLLAWPAWLVRQDPDLAPALVLINLEILLPAGFGIVSAGLLAGDPVRELLLTSPRSAARTLCERMILLWTIGSLLALLLAGLATRWQIGLPQQGLELLFIWLPPLVFFTGAANFFALVRGRPMDGVFACLLLAAAGLAGQPALISVCTLLVDQQGGICPLNLVNPFLTVFSPFDPLWPSNRLFIFLLGGLALFIVRRLAVREERLVSIADVES